MTVRTVVSAAWTAASALSVATSTLSSSRFTRSSVSPRLVDHGQQLCLGVLDGLRHLAQRLAEPEERVEQPDADEEEKRRECEPREVRSGVVGEDHALILRGR